MHARRYALLVVATLAVAACSTTASDVSVGTTVGGSTAATAPGPGGGSTTTGPNRPAASSTTTAPSAGTLTWSSCGKGLQCSTLQVPLDHSDPSKGTISLYIKRRPAGTPKQRVGTLLVNPGGPGVPGTELVDEASAAFSPDLLNTFDIVSWDPRGTGQSEAVHCVDNLDPVFSIDPDPETPAEKQALVDSAKVFDQGCEQNSGKILPYISTQDTARDMDDIRTALGEDKISYFGYSYGSQLGAMYATLFPTHVRAMVIDGASDPNAGYVDNLKQQTVGLERALQALLADCAKDTQCAFHHNGEPQAAYDALMAKLNANPLVVKGATGRPTVGLGVATIAVISGLYDQSFWPLVTDALAAAEGGDGSQLLQLYDAYLERNKDGTFSDEFDGLIAINCLDDPGPTTPAAIDQLAAELAPLSPHFAASQAYEYECVYWPVPQKPPVTITGKGAGPIVVVGTTGDPVTPLESSRNMAAALEHGVLVTVDAQGHTGYGKDRCVVAAVDSYLIDLTVPKTGLVCSS